MIPYGDSLRSRSFPAVNYALILINIGVFFYELMLQTQTVRAGRTSVTELDQWILAWGVVPCRLTDMCPAFAERQLEALSGTGTEWVNLVTSTFIHGGWLHLLGNMLFLWIFGDNIEDAMGHFRYLLFYLVCGVLAGLAQVFSDPTGIVPGVGASGAIAGVLGAYLMTYPRASVQVIIPVIIIPFFVRVPAFLMMLFWFLTQVVSVGSVADARGGSGGVAYWAHIGGFVAGLVLVWLFRGRRRSADLNKWYERYKWQMRGRDR